MKKLFTILLILVSFSGFSQTWNRVFYRPGYQYNGLKTDSILITPNDTLRNKVVGSIAVKNNQLYIKETNKWKMLTGLEVLSSYLQKSDTVSLVATKHDVSLKVDKVAGKGLSTEDYTTTEKNKLAGIAENAEVNVNANWNATSGDAQILNKPIIPNVFENHKTVYVDTLGNNSTARIGRSDKPFSTIDAAIDSLPNGGIIQIGIGEFASPDSAHIKSNLWFKGSGKPVPNWVVTESLGVISKTSPTKLINGTILKGKFDGSKEQNITITDLGIDVGSEWCTAYNGGLGEDGLYFWAYDQYNPHPPLHGIVVENVSVLGLSATASYHAALFENLYYPIVKNLSTYYCAAGIVIKCTGGNFSNLQAFGHHTHGLYIKGNDEIVCRDLVVSDVEVANIGSYDSGGIGFISGSGQNVYNVILDNFSVKNSTQGIYIYATDGNVNDNISILNGMINNSQGNGVTVGTASLNHSTISGIVIRDSGDNGFDGASMMNCNVSNISNYVSANWGFKLGADASTPSNASNVFCDENSDGIYYTGTGLYSTNVINKSATSGDPLTNLVAKQVLLTDNNTENSSVYPTWTISAANRELNISTSKLSFNPYTGFLSTVGLHLDRTIETGEDHLWHGSIQVRNKTDNGWLDLIKRNTTGSEAVYDLSNIGTINGTSHLALGETSSTAYRGDRGKTAYDYSQVGHLPLVAGTSNRLIGALWINTPTLTSTTARAFIGNLADSGKSHFMQLENTGTNIIWGTENSSGNGNIGVGGLPGAAFIGTAYNKPFQIITNNDVSVTVSGSGNMTVKGSIIKEGGTSSQYLMADGSTSTGTGAATMVYPSAGVAVSNGSGWGTSMNISSGTYTPSASSTSNITGSVTFGEATYTRVGDIIHCSVTGSFTVTTGGTLAYMRVSIPFDTESCMLGSGAASIQTTSAINSGIITLSYANYAEFSCYPPTSGQTVTFTLQFDYRVNVTC